jgi:zinc protease
MSSTGRIARLLVAIQTENLGIDYLDKRNSYIEKVTIEDARRVARRLFDPDRLTVVVVGDPANMKVN